MTKSETDMTSWRLWRAVHHPPYRHPVYRRVTRIRSDALPEFHGLERIQPSAWLVLIGLLLLLIMRPSLHTLPLLIFTAPMAVLLLLILVPVVFPLWMVIQSAWWAGGISLALVIEHEQQTYDVLCLFPEGSLGANWAMASGTIRRGMMYSALALTARLLLGIGLLLLGLLALLTPGILADLSDGTITGNDVTAFRTLLDGLALLVAYALHYVQSAALGPVIGVLAPTFTRRRAEAQLGAFGLALAVQVGSYLLFLALALGVIAPLLSGDPAAHPPADALWRAAVQPLLLLGLLITIREGSITALWRLAVYRLNVQHPEETDRVLTTRPRLRR